MPHHVGPLVGLLSVFLTIAFLAFYGGWLGSKRADLVMTFGLLAWMVYMLWVDRFASNPPDRFDLFVEHMSFQFCLAAATGLVLLGANAFSGNRMWWLWMLQAFGGGLVLAVWSWSDLDAWFEAWQWLNLLIAAAVVTALVRRLRQNPVAKSWGVAALSVILMLCGLAEVAWHAHTSMVASAGIHAYPAALVCLWWLLSERFRARVAEETPPHGMGAEASQLERQRLAQDVHDGLGAHLATILSSLDPKDPGQTSLVLSLEQCLLELKILVDSMHEEIRSLGEALATLRYRVQPCLDRSGIAMHWHIDDNPALDELDNDTVTQVLKIAQEAVANVMRHAGATALEIRCDYHEASHSIELSIWDNGHGFVEQAEGMPSHGKGQWGMHRRAAEIGGRLAITSSGGGTRVRLNIPCPEVVKRSTPVESVVSAPASAAGAL